MDLNLELPRRVFADSPRDALVQAGKPWEGRTGASESCQHQASARYVLVHAYDGGWTTNMPMAACRGRSSGRQDDGEPSRWTTGP
jgi:hypothetical protein